MPLPGAEMWRASQTLSLLVVLLPGSLEKAPREIQVLFPQEERESVA